MPPHAAALRWCAGTGTGARARTLLLATTRPQAAGGAKRPRQPMVMVHLQQQRHATHATTAATAATTTAAATEGSPPPEFDWEALMAEKKIWEREDPELVKDLRSDHAGETGAVYIYIGAEAAMRLGPERFSAGARAFVAAHKRTEQEHLGYFDRLLAPGQRSRLLPLWRASGFALGFLPTALGGERAMFATVEAVEAFVELHYNEHIFPLAARPPSSPHRHAELLRLLRHCCADEVLHRDDARKRWLAPGEERPLWARAWAAVVGKGSQAAVAVCRNI